MSRVPKSPAGFIPVDSEEARGIPDSESVNIAYIEDGKWRFERHIMRVARMQVPGYYVQLPPPVEWEEVWTYRFDEDEPAFLLYRNGLLSGKLFATPVGQDVDAVIAKLNEMEMES